MITNKKLFLFFITNKIDFMIQRVQTLYLFFIVVISIVLFFVPLIEFVNGDSVFSLNILGLEFENQENTISISTFPLIVINSLIIVLTSICIIIFKNRNLQIKICKINLFLLSAFLIFTVMYSTQIEEKLGDKGLNTSFGLGIILPIISITLTYLAIRGIKKDQELIRSVDRIR